MRLCRVQVIITLNYLLSIPALELRAQAISGRGLFIRLLSIWMEFRCVPKDAIRAV